MELFESWRQQPPMRDLVEIIARWIGWKPPALPPAPESVENEAAIAALMRQFPDGRVR